MGRERWGWAAILLAGLLLRLASYFQRADLGSFTGMLDTRIYVQIAGQLAQNGLLPDRAFFMSPLYPYLLLGLGHGGVGSVGPLILVQILIGVGGLLLLALAVRREWSSLAGLSTLALGSFAAPMILYDTALLPDGPASGLLGVGLAAVLLQRRSERPWMILAGLAAAGAFLLRSNLLLPFGAILVGLWVTGRRQRRRALILTVELALPLLLAVLALSLLNHAAEGLLAPRSYNAGLNLYVGNNPNAEGTYTAINEIHPGDPTGKQAAEAVTGRSLNSAEVDRFWRDRAWSYLRHDPGHALSLWWRKLLLVLHPQELAQMEDLNLERRESWALRSGFVGFGLLLALSILGSWNLRPPKRRPSWPLVVAIFSGVAVCVVFFVNGRLRLPLWPALLPFAGMGIAVLHDSFRRRTLRPILPPLALAFTLLLALSFVPTHAVFVQARSAARYATLEALAGHPERARRWLAVMKEIEKRPARLGGGRAIERTYRAKPASALLLRTERAAALYALGDLQGAFEELVVVADRRPDFMRAQRGLYEVSTRLLQSGVRDPRVVAARDRAQLRLGRQPH